MSQSFAEFDVVRSKHMLSDKVPSNSRGTIVMVYDTSPKRYEVEFVGDGVTLDVVTVAEDDLELVWQKNGDQPNFFVTLFALFKKKLAAWREKI